MASSVAFSYTASRAELGLVAGCFGPLVGVGIDIGDGELVREGHMPQQLHHIVPVDFTVFLKVSVDIDRELLGEGNVPQQLHHIIPVYNAVLVHIAGDVSHDLDIKAYGLITVGHSNGLGAQGIGGKACCGETVGNQLAGAVGVAQLQS